MTTPLPELVVFDIAGTTIHATDLVPDAFRNAFASVNIALSDEEISDVRGKSKPDAIGELLLRRGTPETPAGMAAAIYDQFRRGLAQAYRAKGVTPVEGAEATFHWLKSQGVRIALTTGFDRTLVTLLIELAGWEGLADAVVCNEDVAHGRPAPDLVFEAMIRTACEDAGRVAVVGDTVSDLGTAAAAGAGWAFAVLSGAHGRERLFQHPHTAILDSVKDLPEYFSR